MQFTEHVADHGRRFTRLRCGVETQLIHRIQDAALHGFLAVAHVGQGAALDDGDGVIEIGALGESGEGQRFAVEYRFIRQGRIRLGIVK